MDIFPVSWACGDVTLEDQHSEFLITLFGKTPEAQLIAVRIEFYPYFFVGVPRSWGIGQHRLFIAEAASKHGALARHCRSLKRTSLWGFTNGTQIDLVQLAFPSLKKMKWAARALKATHVTYEASMDPLLRFFHIRDITPSAWVTVSGSVAPVPQGSKVTRAKLEVRVPFGAIGASQRTDHPPLIFASYDLECVSASRRFPKADNPDDAIIQIATTYQRYGESAPYKTSVMCLRKTSDVDGVDIQWFHEEHQALNAWIAEIKREHVDVLLGYNTSQFDAPYIIGRAEVLVDDETAESRVHMDALGRMREGGGMSKTWELNSGAFGDNKFTTFLTPGVLQIDMLQILRRETKHESYTLNAMAKHYLQDAKLDLPAHEIFTKFDGSPDDRALIAAYAAKDTELPLRLLSKLCVFQNLMEMANATFVPLEYVLTRGQQIKTYSLLMRKARLMGFACPDNMGIGVVGKYVGATVLEAKKGAYFDIVSGLDFASLYPSIIRAWDLDYSTIVLDAVYAHIPGVEYYEVSTDQGTFRYAQGQPSVLPSLLKDLAMFRKDAKHKMAHAKAAGDSFGASLFNAVGERPSTCQHMPSCFYLTPSPRVIAATIGIQNHDEQRVWICGRNEGHASVCAHCGVGHGDRAQND